MCGALLSSFDITVENIFYVTYLVKEYKATVIFPEDELPLVRPTRRRSKGVSASGDSSEGDAVSDQAILTMNMKDFEELIDIYDLKGKKPLLRIRDEN